MAWARSRKCREGVVWYVSRRAAGGKVETVRLGVVDKSVARAAAKAQSERDGTRARPEAIAPLAALGKFCAHWAEVRRRSPETVEFYRERLAPLFRALAARGPMRSWREAWFEEYVREHADWKPRTVQALAVAARTFTKWARRKGYACAEFARDYESPRVVRGGKAAYSVDEARALLRASAGTSLEVPVALAFWAGLSWGDVAKLTRADVARGWITRPRSKTGVPNLVPIARPLARVLKDAELPCALPKGSDPWRRLCERAGVPSAGGLKRLRRTYYTLLTIAQVDQPTRTDLMGHTPRNVTEGYGASDMERLRRGIEALERVVSLRSASASPSSARGRRRAGP